MWKPSEQRTALFSVDGIEDCSAGGMIFGLVSEETSFEYGENIQIIYQ